MKAVTMAGRKVDWMADLMADRSVAEMAARSADSKVDRWAEN